MHLLETGWYISFLEMVLEIFERIIVAEMSNLITNIVKNETLLKIITN